MYIKCILRMYIKKIEKMEKEIFISLNLFETL